MPANKPKPTYSIAAQSASDAEGDSGTTPLTFTVTRSSGNGTATIDYAVTGAQADDFAGGALPSGTVTFAKGQKISEPVTISVAGDTLVELDENFTVTLSNPSQGKIGTGTAQGTILNDDNDSNNAPIGLSDDLAGSVNENVAAGAIIIDLNATDVDGDTVSYYFKDGDGTHVQTTADGNFTIDVDTGVVTTARAFDFENDGASLSFTAFA